MSAGQWAFWLAFSALFAGAGKFLDDYHIKAATKSKVRSILVTCFIWVDQKSVPDLGGWILALIKKLFSIRGLLLCFIVFCLCYLASLVALYVGREIFGPPNIESLYSYIVNWIPMDESALMWLGFILAIVVSAFIGLVVTARFFHHASINDSDLKRIMFLVIGIISGVAIALGGTALSIFLYAGGGYTTVIIFFASLASSVLPGLLVCLTIMLIVIRLALRFVQFLLLRVFDVASSPSVSPFTYASSLFSVLLLGAKVIQATVFD